MRNAQQGTSYITILFAIIVFAMVVKAVVAIWPAYWDNRVINSQIEELLKDSPADITPAKFTQQMDQRLDMNNIDDLQFKDIAQVSNDQGLHVNTRYEVRKPFLLNIDLVLSSRRVLIKGHSKVSDFRLPSRIGYQFKQPELLQLALTHRSVSHKYNYERLEF